MSTLTSTLRDFRFQDVIIRICVLRKRSIKRQQIFEVRVEKSMVWYSDLDPQCGWRVWESSWPRVNRRWLPFVPVLYPSTLHDSSLSESWRSHSTVERSSSRVVRRMKLHGVGSLVDVGGADRELGYTVRLVVDRGREPYGFGIGVS